MRIIAKVSEEKFLIECSHDEVANLVGYNYASSMPKKIEVGNSFQIREAYQQLQSLSKVKKTVKDIKKTILEVANGLDVINDYPEILSPERKSES